MTKPIRISLAKAAKLAGMHPKRLARLAADKQIEGAVMLTEIRWTFDKDVIVNLDKSKLRDYRKGEEDE